ncbi:hypothetical protein [Neobacillus drentensis]|uniref:hypothetical protein n=1 Tax=Neobacillus drentensis TaxID=220684 RepID=UPI002FFE6002
MAANWKLNAILGFIAFLLTYLFSVTNNTWQTSMLRACLGFVLFFVLGYLLRFALNQMIIKQNLNAGQANNPTEESNTSPDMTNQVDVGLEDAFQQIPLQSIHKGENTKVPEEISGMIRNWTTQD